KESPERSRICIECEHPAPIKGVDGARRGDPSGVPRAHVDTVQPGIIAARGPNRSSPIGGIYVGRESRRKRANAHRRVRNDIGGVVARAGELIRAEKPDDTPAGRVEAIDKSKRAAFAFATAYIDFAVYNQRGAEAIRAGVSHGLIAQRLRSTQIRGPYFGERIGIQAIDHTD